MCTLYIYFVYIRGGTLHVFILNRHGMGIWVRCMTPYDKYRQFTPNPEGSLAVMQCRLITASRRTVNASESHELRSWKQSPLDSDHVLILNASLTLNCLQNGALCSCVLPLSFAAQIQIFHNISIFADITSLNAKLLFIMQMIGLYFSHVPNVPTADVWFTVFYFDKVPPVLLS